MAATKDWIIAFRLRTLPLAVSSILLGCLLAYGSGSFSWSVAILAVTTTLLLQILSNLANDYGDAKSGVDGAERVGPTRRVQDGVISASAMKRAIYWFVGLSLFSGVGLIVAGALQVGWPTALLFFGLGIAAIAAAIKYTVGKHPYGYQGLGDVFVLLFFGWVGVMGTWYLHTHRLDWLVILPATAVGLLAVGVLNLNNMRDHESDAKTGKRSLVVKMGFQSAKVYHTLILLGAVLSAGLYIWISGTSPWQWLYLLILPILIGNVKTVWVTTDPQQLDPELKKVALSALLFALTFGIGHLL